MQRIKDKNLANGFDVDTSVPYSSQCEDCIRAKQSALPFPEDSHMKANKPAEIIVSDVWGPSQITSISGEKYFVTFTDVYSRNMSLKLLKEKSDVYDAFVTYANTLEQ